MKTWMFALGVLTGAILGALVGGVPVILHSCWNGVCFFKVSDIALEALKYALVGAIGIGIAFGLFFAGLIKDKK